MLFYKSMIFCLLAGILQALYAQPTVDVCLRKTATKLEVVLTSNGSFTGLVSNVQMTIKCSDPTVTFALPGDLQLFCSMAKGGDERVSGGAVYQKFGGIGFLALSTLGISWASGTETVLFSVVPSSLSPTFEIINDSWTAANNGAYYAELNALDKTGSIIVCGATLPIEGLQLEADKLEKGGVMLSWATEQEFPDSRFILLKRGNRNGNGFSILGEVEGAGLPTYQFHDKGPLQAVNYYQLRQVNPDGSKLLSNVVEVSAEEASGIQLYPNPAISEAFIQMREINELEKRITLYDNVGRQLMRLSSDNSLIRLDINALPAGLYQLKVEQGNMVWEKSLVKILE